MAEDVASTNATGRSACPAGHSVPGRRKALATITPLPIAIELAASPAEPYLQSASASRGTTAFRRARVL